VSRRAERRENPSDKQAPRAAGLADFDEDEQHRQTPEKREVHTPHPHLELRGPGIGGPGRSNPPLDAARGKISIRRQLLRVVCCGGVTGRGSEEARRLVEKV
jgi:hypothetical protein